MSQSLTLRYTPIEQDYAKVLRLFFLQRTGTRISLALLVIAFGLIIFAIVANGAPPTIYELIWIILPPVFVVFVFYIQPARVAKQASENEQLITEATWEVNDDGIEISSRFGSIHLGWEGMKKLVTTKEYYLLLLKVNKNAFRFLPRRAFSSPQEQDQFVEMMRNHLPA
jgi:hypothetical protein